MNFDTNIVGPLIDADSLHFVPWKIIQAGPIWKRIFYMRWVISDPSVLIPLTRIGQLALLEKIFGRITITPSVWDEVVERGGGRSGVFAALAWLK
ncbi:MAG: hypothetical protein V1897_05100 [Pseudomonadota bacterium]